MPSAETAACTPPTLTFRNGIKIEVLDAGVDIFRIHHRDASPIWFGPKPGLPPAYRFDAPGGEYRTMYAAAALEGAFAETILHGRPAGQIVSRAYVEQRAWTAIKVLRPLKLMKLHGEGLFWHGVDARVSAADTYDESRRVALVGFREAPDLDGVTYRSRHDNGELCHALFDRVLTNHLKTGMRQLFSEHAAELKHLMARYGAVLDTTPPILAP